MRVVIVADSVLVAESIRGIVRHAPGVRILGYVSTTRPCGAAIADANADVVIVDDPHGTDSTLERVREVRAAAPSAKIVLLTPDMEQGHLAEATTAGIDAAIARGGDPARIRLLVSAVTSGDVFHAFMPPPSGPPAESALHGRLTSRELEVLSMVAGGLSNRRIASKLWLTEQTVKFHLSNTYRKLGVGNRTQAAHYAHLHGLVNMPAMETRTYEPATPVAA
jgi:DNA-binding NarL/FixJ family response regulator